MVGLLQACAQGDIQFLRKYVSDHRHQEYYNVTDNHRWGALHHAVASGSYECVRLLLSTRYINTRKRSHEGHTCLYVGVERRISGRIIRMLLKYDRRLIDIPNNEQIYPMHVAITNNSLDLIRTMVDTLREKNVEIGNQIDFDGDNSLFLAVRERNEEIVDYLINNTEPNYQHRNGADINAISVAMVPVRGASENAVYRIVMKLLPVTYDLTSDHLMQDLMLPMMFSAFHPNEDTFNWFVNEYYLSDNNTQRDVFIRAMTTFGRDNETKKLFLALHSNIREFIITERDSVQNEILYNNLFTTLLKFYGENPAMCREVVTAIRPKLNLRMVKRAVPNIVPLERKREICYATYAEMIFELGLGSLFNIIKILDRFSKRYYAARVLTLLMPFSSEPTADVLDGALPFAESLSEDKKLARFCVDGRFRAFNDLKGMCRAVIRRCILCGNESFEEKMTLLRQLGLPRSLFNYLLFNYTGYEFT